MGKRFRAALVTEYIVALLVGAASLYLLDAAPMYYGAWAAAVLIPFVVLSGSGNYADAYMRLTLPLMVGVLMYAIYYAAHDFGPAADRLTGNFDDFDQYIGEQYYAVMSTLFAIITALILVKGIESFDRLNAVIVEEANQIRSIVEFLYYFEEDDSDPHGVPGQVLKQTHLIREHLLRYCNQGIEDPAAITSNSANTILRDTTKVVGAIQCADDNDRLALAEVMRALNQLFAIRARRVACSRAKVPFYMIVTLGFMSLAIVLPFFIGEPAQHPYNAWIIFVLTTFCIFILMLLRDINSPFEGFWQVDVKAFVEIRDDIAARQSDDLGQEQATVYGLATRGRTEPVMSARGAPHEAAASRGGDEPRALGPRTTQDETMR